jgi:hypothetical protein
MMSDFPEPSQRQMIAQLKHLARTLNWRRSELEVGGQGGN